MQDRNGHRLDIGMILKVVNQTDVLFDYSGWILIDWVEMGVLTYYILRHCITHEVRIFESKDIERG